MSVSYTHLDGNHEAGAKEHGGQTRVHGRETEAAEGSGQPAATDASHSRSVVDDDERQAEMGQVQIEFCGEKPGQPEKIEPPDGIGEELADGKGPGLAEAEQ